MTIASLDFGKRRIGLALAYDERGAAIPLEVIERKSLVRDLQRVARRLAELEVTRLIVGLPLNMDGTEGPQARAALVAAASRAGGVLHQSAAGSYWPSVALQ